MSRASIFSVILILSMNLGCGNRKESAEQTEPVAAQKEKSIETLKEGNIVFFGNSLTAGYGLDPSEAFPALIQARIDSLKLPYKVINAGLSGETSSGGKSRIDWILQQPVDVFILELGANDGLRGIPVSETARNLQSIIDQVRQKYPEAKLLLLGMEVPPNMGKKYTSEFRQVFRDLAEKNSLLFVPFLLDGVGGVPELNLADGIHPTAEGHKILAKNVWEVLGEVL
jgi:acyl-CoA thioesterase I